MGCPSGTCTGYELMNSLDFDTDGDGDVDTDDAYANWAPITATYSGDFNGNGHIIANMTINSSGIPQVGLFSQIGSGGTIENLGLTDVNITAAWPSGLGSLYVGGVAGRVVGTVRTSYVTGAITTTAGAVSVNTSAGGLIGNMGWPGATGGSPSRIDASWAAVNVASTSSSTSGTADAAGGLVGRVVANATATATITASYATGTATSARSGALVGGLIGAAPAANTTITASYWDTTTSAIADDADSAAPEGLATAALQTPTGYTGIYENWNIDVDGDDENDDPWNFGTGSQYPALKYGGHDYNGQGQPFDYDTDDDGLIEITNLAQLNAIRHDLDGNGDPANATYNSVFPLGDRSAAGRMGCPLGTCTGYELLNNLDFDTDGDGATYTTSAMGVVAVDADDTGNYFNGAAGWTPLGGHGATTRQPFTATFEGNHHTISNLFINLDTAGEHTGKYVGLFADIGIAEDTSTSPTTPAVPGAVQNVGLVNPYVHNERDGAHSTLINYVRTGALAGSSSAAGAVSGSWVAGGSVTSQQNAVATGTVFNFAGCLLGYNGGTVTGSSASCNATATGADDASDYAGGLLGWNQGAVTGSYATGTATADSRAGGLAAELTVGGTVIASYATGAVSVTGDGGVAGGLVASMSSASTAVRASYATGAVSTSGAGTSMAPNKLGGLAGQISGTAPVIAASYSIGTVTGGTGTNSRGGLVGALVSSATASQVTNSYWDETTTGIAGTGTGVRKTTTQLRTPTAYGTMSTDIYMSWNLNLDGQTGNDDPWHFGTNAQYPLLKYGHDAASVAGQIARQAGADLVDYDADNDNLIEISALAQLDAVRYDLDGNGQGVVGDDAVAYAAAFPGLPKGMGCPAVCQGYELTADLDFDTDGDGQTYTISGGTVTVDAGDTDNFFDASEGWAPIGNNTTGYSGVFEGNRHVIDNLFINVPNNSANDVARERVGLFAKVDRGGVIRGVSLTDVYMNRERTGTGIVYAGALVGQSFGTVTASSATGEVRAIDAYASSSSQVGGLVGESGNRSAVNASWADVAVTVDGPMVRAGGLVGASLAGKIVASHAFGDVNVDDSPNGRVGGLVGSLNLLGAVPATVTASYARGEVAGSGTSTTGRVLGGLVGGGSSSSGVTDSYWDNSTSGTNQASSYGGGEGKTTAELQSITGYTGIYANWNVDVDGAMGNDDPWHFGANDQYPTLKYGGFSPAAQGSSGTDYDTDSDGLIEITTLAQLDAIPPGPGRRRAPHCRPRLPVRLPRRRCGQRRPKWAPPAAWAAPTALP